MISVALHKVDFREFSTCDKIIGKNLEERFLTKFYKIKYANIFLAATFTF